MGWLAAATNNNNSRALSCVRVCVRGQSEERVLNSRRNTAINQPTSARAGARQAVTASSGVVGGWACVGFFLGGTRSLHRSIRRGVRSVERAVCLRLEMKRETWLLHARRDFGLVSRSGRAPAATVGARAREFPRRVKRTRGRRCGCRAAEFPAVAVRAAMQVIRMRRPDGRCRWRRRLCSLVCGGQYDFLINRENDENVFHFSWV